MNRKSWLSRGDRKGDIKGIIMDEEGQGSGGGGQQGQGQSNQRGSGSFWEFPSLRALFRQSAPVNPTTPEIIVTACSSETLGSGGVGGAGGSGLGPPVISLTSSSASLGEIKEEEVGALLLSETGGGGGDGRESVSPSAASCPYPGGEGGGGDEFLLDLPSCSEEFTGIKSRRVSQEEAEYISYPPPSQGKRRGGGGRGHERRKSDGVSSILMNPLLLDCKKSSLGNTLRLPKTFRKRSRSYCDLRLSSSPRRSSRTDSEPSCEMPELSPIELRLILMKGLRGPNNKKTEKSEGKKEALHIAQLNEILHLADHHRRRGSSSKKKSRSDDNIIDPGAGASSSSKKQQGSFTGCVASAGLGAISTGLLPAASVASLLDNRMMLFGGGNNLQLPAEDHHQNSEQVGGGEGGVGADKSTTQLLLESVNATLPRIRSRPRLLSHPEFSLPDSIQTAPISGSSPAKRFFIPPYFRRPSQMSTQGILLSESMVSLTNRALVSFINDENFSGLQHLLDNRRVVVDDRDEAGCTALMIAASKGKANFVRLLLEHGADINSEDQDGWTALHFAAKEGNDEIVADLLDHGALVDKTEMGGWTPLMWACYKGRTKTSKLLIEKNAEVNAYGNFHVTCLAWASGRGHGEIVKELLLHGARVNSGDKYGTTPLIWASRKGFIEIVDMLLGYEASVDACGMTSWTPLLVATQGNHVEVVKALLEHKPNINALDKDGCSALTIACKDGFHEIAICLISHGAYININDRGGTSNLIHAAKGGHRSIVESLLKKHADVNFQGKDRKTALYWAVEKSHVNVVKLLLATNPDLELATKDGDTPLMKAVRNRNVEIVSLLMDKRAKVGAADKNGDTCLHIAMRARSKHIVELILRNPINSQLLYRPNRAGETPYNIDRAAPKPIMTQIFGSRGLNTQEDGENLLGYNLYSSALADMLSDPTLNTPITVGLFARWGSGKSFLLSKLREEMKNFARQWLNPSFSYDFLILLIIVCIAAVLGVVGGLALQSWIVGLAFGGGFILVGHILLLIIWFTSRRSKYEYSFSNKVSTSLARKMESLRAISQVIFCHPPGSQSTDQMQAQPINFYFTEQTKISTTTGGENSVVQMLGSLYACIENDYGVMSTRLYRAFRPRPVNATSGWKWRKLCCIPYFVIFLMCFACTLVWIVVLAMYLTNKGADSYSSERLTLQIIFYTCAFTVGMFLVANVYTIGRVLKAIVLSHRRHLQRTVSKLDAVKAEGFLQALKAEVNLMTNMVKCLDAFNGKQSRLVVIVDGLDSGEQEKVLQVLDAVHILFSDAKAPFIILLAVDPHIIAKGIELNINPVLNESNIGGHDYLRNLVHLPFFLQNAALRKVKHVKMLESSIKRSSRLLDEEGPGFMLSARRPSVESGFQLQLDRFDKPSSKKAKKLGLKMSESIASSLGSNLNRVTSNINMPILGVGGPSDLKKMLLGDDYFSDVNPRSMRRLMNIIHITGRLLKSFSIDFNWYHLSAWVNVTEQWPYRLSWMIIYCEQFQKDLDDQTSLKAVYEKVRPFVPTAKEIDPNVVLDRDEKKLDVYLGLHKGSLVVSTLYVFLPFTISLDPQLRKDITEQYQPIDQIFKMNPPTAHPPAAPSGPSSGGPPATSPFIQSIANSNAQQLRLRNSGRYAIGQGQTQPAIINPFQMMAQQQQFFQGYGNGNPPWNGGGPFGGGGGGYHPGMLSGGQAPVQMMEAINIDSALIKEFKHRKLSAMNVEAVCELVVTLTGIKSSQVTNYKEAVRKNNICGRVLMSCDMMDLKLVLQMTFGDWELFKAAILILREVEKGRLHLSSSPTTDDNANPKQSGATAPPNPDGGAAGGKIPRNSSGKDLVRISVTSPASPPASSKSPSVPSDQHHPAPHEVPPNTTTRKGSSSHSQAPQLVRPNVLEKQVTMEEQMICGALELLNEEAKEDALKGEDSPTSTLSPINSEPESYHHNPDVRKSSRAYLAQDETDVLYVSTSLKVTAELPDSPSVVRKLEEAEARYAVINETANQHHHHSQQSSHQNYATVLRNVSSTSAISEPIAIPSTSSVGIAFSQGQKPNLRNYSFSGSTIQSNSCPSSKSSKGVFGGGKGKDSPRKQTSTRKAAQQSRHLAQAESSSDASSDESQKPLVMKPLGADAKQPRKGVSHRPPRADGGSSSPQRKKPVSREESMSSRFSKLKSSLFGSGPSKEPRSSVDYSSASSSASALLPPPVPHSSSKKYSKGKPPVRYDLPTGYDSSEPSQYFREHGHEWKAVRVPPPLPPFGSDEYYAVIKSSNPSPTTSNESEPGSTPDHLSSKEEIYLSENPDYQDDDRGDQDHSKTVMFRPSPSSPAIPRDETNTALPTFCSKEGSPHPPPPPIVTHVIENPLSSFVPIVHPQPVLPSTSPSSTVVPPMGPGSSFFAKSSASSSKVPPPPHSPPYLSSRPRKLKDRAATSSGEDQAIFVPLTATNKKSWMNQSDPGLASSSSTSTPMVALRPESQVGEFSVTTKQQNINESGTVPQIACPTSSTEDQDQDNDDDNLSSSRTRSSELGPGLTRQSAFDPGSSRENTPQK